LNAQGAAPLISADAIAKKASPKALLSQSLKGKKAGSKPSLADALLPNNRKTKVSFLEALGAAARAKGAKTAGPAIAEDLAAAKKKAVNAKVAHAPEKAVPAVATEVKNADEKSAKAQPKKKGADASVVLSLAAAPAVKAAAPSQGAAEPKKAGASGDSSPAPAAAASARTAQKLEPKLVVVDLRKKSDAKTSSHEGAADALKVPSQVAADKDAGAQFSQRLGALRDGLPEADQKPPAAPSAPQSAGQDAMERLREMSGSELIRASNMILKEGGGEIRLVLKPESLGSIRIRMNLVDNHIEGRIVVDSSAVKQVIDGSIDALTRALTAEGFQTGALQVSVGGQNAHSERQAQEPPPAVQRVVAQGFERNVPGIENLSLGDLLVNLFV
jgi:flagellar protein FlbC